MIGIFYEANDVPNTSAISPGEYQRREKLNIGLEFPMRSSIRSSSPLPLKKETDYDFNLMSSAQF